ncbi:MAG: twin-arginine translocase TatA/TatE family subunit [Verrucomicrobiia bacterium]|nr:twin-arginine translocase TatA/TatE family subunit [Verrucomicrobiota bacterium]
MQNVIAAWSLSGGEILLIAIALLILFGARKIPEFAKGLGQGIKEFKKATHDNTDPKA